MKNDYCELTRQEALALQIPDTLMGWFLSPFQFATENGTVYVPDTAFREAIGFLVDHAKTLHAQKVAGAELPERKLYTRYLPGVVPSNAVEVNAYKDGWNECRVACEPLAAEVAALRARVAELEAAAEALP